MLLLCHYSSESKFLHTGFEDIVKYLIDNHADVNMTDKNGHSSLYIALKEGNQ